MRSPRLAALIVALMATSVAGCSTPNDLLIRDDEYVSPPPRAHWALSYGVVESDRLQVNSKNLSSYEESIGLAFPRAKGRDPGCFVSVSVPGQGGPSNMIGEKTSTTFREWPAVRSGAGAEVDYLMWQLPDSSWVEISCENEDAVNRVATVVQKQESDLRLPFDLDALPDGYSVSSIQQNIGTETSVYVDRVGPTSNRPDVELQIFYGTGERARQPIGRAITVNGRASTLSEDPRSPSVCVLTKPSPVCVSVYTGDTGPYPDRPADIPVLLQTADSLRFPKDLEDDATWFAAAGVFG